VLPDPPLPGPVPPTHPHGLVPESTELTLSKKRGEDEPDAGADNDLCIHTFMLVKKIILAIWILRHNKQSKLLHYFKL
jgi:hypothetical protein